MCERVCVFVMCDVCVNVLMVYTVCPTVDIPGSHTRTPTRTLFCLPSRFQSRRSIRLVKLEYIGIVVSVARQEAFRHSDRIYLKLPYVWGCYFFLMRCTIHSRPWYNLRAKQEQTHLISARKLWQMV